MDDFLKNLPDIDFAQKDTQGIESEIISHFESSLVKQLYPGDPIRLFVLNFVKYLTLQRTLIDFSAKQNLLRYAAEGYAEHLGALLNVKRLEPSAAVTTLEFTISTPQPSNLIIPAGTRATPGNSIYFATVEAVEVKAGELTVQAHAVCTEAGEKGNGYLVSQINKIVDPFPMFESVRNTTVSMGGADLEKLNAFKQRIQEAPESFSVAGPAGAYIFWAKTASQAIVDVSVETPEPGVVEIIPLMSNGEIPTQDILDKVYDICSRDDKRPLTDYVKVRSPETLNYALEFTYYISRKNSASGLSIQNNVNAAIDKYILWQKSRLGRDLNPSELIKMIMECGVKRVEVKSPAYTVIYYYQIAIADSVKVTYGGLEDD